MSEPAYEPVRARWSRTPALLALVFAFLAGFYRVRTFDTFFHLAAGRWIVERGAVPEADPFSFTFRGAPWSNHSWGFQALVFGLERWGGFEALSAYQALTSFALAAVVIGFSRAIPRLSSAAAVFTLLPMVAFREVIEVRPHVLGFLALALSLGIALRVARTRELRMLSWLVPVYAGWATAHGSHVLIYAIVGLGALTRVVLRDGRAALAWLACGLSLFGLGLWLAPSAFAQGGQHVASTFLESSVLEWYPVTFGDLVSYWPGRAFLGCWVLSLCGAVLAHRDPSRARADALAIGPFPVLLLAIFMLGAFTSRRMIALYALGAAPLWVPYAALATTELARAVAGASHEVSRMLSRAANVALLALGALLFAPNDMFQAGLGLEPNRVPSRAVQAMRKAGRIERLYNAYNFGGYLMWERYPEAGVFVDGRAITVYPGAFLEAFERAYDDPRVFEALARRYAIDAVLLPSSSERVRLLRAYLGQSARYRRTYSDDVAEVYELTR